MLIREENFDEIIRMIRTIHQTSIDQRQWDFNEYLMDVFQSIDDMKFFRLLTDLLRDYDDRIALKIAFVESKCLDTFDRILRKEINDEEHLISIFECLAELLVNSENVQQKFLESHGYETILPFLHHIHSPSIDFLNKYLLLMTTTSTLIIDSSQTLVDLFVQFVNPHMARILIQWIPDLLDTSTQQHLIHSVNILVSRSIENKMIACSNGIISAFLNVLAAKNIEEKILIDHIFSILEKLSRFSISAQEIRQICQLFTEQTNYKKQLLRVLITAAKNDDPDTQRISSYFDLQHSNSGIILPAIRRWPTVSSSALHLTFHYWLRLNDHIDSYPLDSRRQLYSFYSDTIGLEAFVYQSSIYILVSDRRELGYIEVNECDELLDGCWHSLTIVHTAQRPSLFVAAFQSISTCYLTIYIDGLVKKQVKDFKYLSLVNESIPFASIGAPSERARLPTSGTKSDSYLSTSLAKGIQPLKGLFGSKNRNHRSEHQPLHSQSMITVEPHTQDSLFGPSTSLHGQLACVWIVAESLNETQVKLLHSLGADFPHQHVHPPNEEISSIFDLLSTRSLVLYHPLACNGQICVDISVCTSQMNGRLNNGRCYRLQSFAQSLSTLGGCPILYPLMEKFDEKDFQFDLSTDWSILRQSSQKHLPDIDNRSISNPIASIVNLIRCILSSNSLKILSEQMIKNYNVELFAQHLIRLSGSFLDQQFLVSIQQLIESCRMNSSLNPLASKFIQNILFEFQLWNRAKFPVRMSHLQYITTVIKDERKFYRMKFGVQYFLDILKQYFHSGDEDPDEQKQLRSALYGIIRYYIQRHVRIEELNAILSSISTFSTSSDVITQELLEFILAMLDPPSISTDTTIGLLCEPNMCENLYALLTVNHLSSQTKEIVLKIVKYLLAAKRVPQQIRAQLRLETNQIGFGGIISGLGPQELTVSIVREILNLIIHSDSATAMDHLNVVLTLCSAASLDIRYVAIRKLMTCFIANPNACRLYAKCHGWQETLAHFFLKTRRTPSITHVISSSASMGALSSYMKDSSVDSVPPQVFEISSSPDDPHKENTVRQLDLSPINDMKVSRTSRQSSLSSSILTTTMNTSIDGRDTTPEFLRRNSEEFPSNTINTPLQSSTTSREDLLSTDDLTSISSTNETTNTLPTTPLRGVTSTEDSSFVLPSSSHTEDGGLLEELCETLILTIVMILWKGVTGSDEESWMIRGEIFSALRYLHREYDFHLPLVYIERRILELSMETCLNEFKIHGAYHAYDRLYRRRMSDIRKTTPAYENNCRELIKIVDDFLEQSPDGLTENLVNGIIPILDTLLIFEENGTGDQTIATLVSHDEHWTETSLTGLNILLILLAHSNTLFCASASVRIHSLLHSRPLNGREEAAYLLYHVNKIFTANTESEHLTYLLPIIKTLIDKSYEILQMNVQIPNIPLHKATSTALEDFRQYSSNEEWHRFIQRQIEPLAEHYRSMSIKPFHMNMKIWWNNCHEMMMIGIHKRNRQMGEEKLKFQSHIVDQWRDRRRMEHHRLVKLAKQRRIHQVHIESEWKDRQKYFFGERGPWYNVKTTSERHWMLSDRENIHRMRCKLVENDEFNRHEEASRSRDNLGVESRQVLMEESLKNQNLLFLQDILHGNIIDEQELLAATNETQSLLLDEKEKIIIGTQCSLITSTFTTDGKLEITNKYIYFFDSNPQKSSQNDFKYPLSWLQDVHLRRYNLRPSALEFFLLNQTSFLMNFDKKLRRQTYQKLMSLKLPSMKSTFSSNLSMAFTPQEILKESKLTERWVTREISNFDYLMMLNTIAGRTFNDLNQYPIFPWVLKDYTSDILDLNNPEVFRDLSKPIGVQNPKHIEDVRLKYESFDDPTGLMKKFHYGTHYSNAASVMHYLIRLEPFTTLHIQLQSGTFDIADRQFHSFQSAWTNIMDSPNEVKELIPEFFYLPEFLVNSNRFDLGKLQISNEIINDVHLPPWANQSSEEFIRLHRLALESDYVSAHLHEWIDLIFGYKQTGQAAIDALNVFMYCSYENAVDVDAIDDPITREAVEGMIQNFGQVPSQLLMEPHPQRQTREQAAFEIESQGRVLNIFENLSHIRAFFVEITPADEKLCDPITFISIPKNQIRSFMQQGIPDTLVTVSVNGVVGNNGWQPYDKSLSNFFTFERDPTLQTERSRHIIAAPFSPVLEINSRLFAVSHDAKFVFSGGHWDWSLRVYSLLKSKMISSIIHHTDIITCLALDSTGYILVTGSRDTTCVIWNLSFGESRNLSNTNEQESNTLLSPALTLYGHTSEITSIAVSIELDLVVSGSLDGTCNIHTVECGIYLRTIRPSMDPIRNLQLSSERHILIHTENVETYLYLYSINGELIRTRKLEYDFVDMILSEEHIVLAVNHLPSNKASNLAAARIIIKDMFEMKTIQTIRLRTQINCLYFTKDFSHLLVGVQDGKLIVLTAEKKSLSKSALFKS